MHHLLFYGINLLLYSLGYYLELCFLVFCPLLRFFQFTFMLADCALEFFNSSVLCFHLITEVGNFLAELAQVRLNSFEATSEALQTGMVVGVRPRKGHPTLDAINVLRWTVILQVLL